MAMVSIKEFLKFGKDGKVVKILHVCFDVTLGLDDNKSL